MPERVIMVMGVCGVGKSTVAQGIARSIDAGFVEADLYHPPENIAAMSAGIPLTDDMRWGWLEAVGDAVIAAAQSGPVVFACSALKHAYRDRLRHRIGPFRIIYLHGDRDLIAQRMAARTAHFMPPELLDSQLHDLEPPARDREAAIWLDIVATPDELITCAAAELGASDGALTGTQLRRTS